jgi:hypothetical protein
VLPFSLIDRTPPTSQPRSAAVSGAAGRRTPGPAAQWAAPGMSVRDRRECVCVRVRHRHGTQAAYRRDGCRCAECTAANTRACRDRRRLLAVQAWHGTVPVWVHPVGSRRRLQALTAAGWSTTQLAAELGVGRSAIAYLRSVRQDRMLASTATDVSTLYERLWWRTPPGCSTTRSERYAERHGWVPPWLWDGIDIDDPAAKPLPDRPILDDIAISRARAGRAVSLTRDERRRLELELEQQGSSAAAIAQHLGQSPRTVQRHRAAARRSSERAA